MAGAWISAVDPSSVASEVELPCLPFAGQTYSSKCRLTLSRWWTRGITWAQLLIGLGCLVCGIYIATVRISTSANGRREGARAASRLVWSWNVAPEAWAIHGSLRRSLQITFAIALFGASLEVPANVLVAVLVAGVGLRFVLAIVLGMDVGGAALKLREFQRKGGHVSPRVDEIEHGAAYSHNYDEVTAAGAAVVDGRMRPARPLNEARVAEMFSKTDDCDEYARWEDPVSDSIGAEIGMSDADSRSPAGPATATPVSLARIGRLARDSPASFTALRVLSIVHWES